MKRTYFSIGLVTALMLAGCGGDDPTDPNDPNPNPINKVESDYAVDATISGSGGSAIKGQGEQAMPGQFTATVAGGELIVYLMGGDGTLVFFRIDTTRAGVPGKVDVGSSESPTFLTITSAMSGIWESRGGGKIAVDQCPERKDQIITGSFEQIALGSPMGGEGNSFSGSFKAAIAMHDGSHKCGGKEPVDPTDPEPQKAPPGCAVAACDGPCCPYEQCMVSCTTGCMQTKCTGFDFMGCATCLNGCPEKCGVSAECLSAMQTLSTCAEKYECEPGPIWENPCIGQNCCAEFNACY